ncbi:MAG: iron hydrogenase [Ruminococcaceae bacterium]|nr:iron hydrogenase [Oscillospiraceae bacterium]
MQTFHDLYKTLTKAALENKLKEELRKLEKGTFNPYHLGCLLHPEHHSLTINDDTSMENASKNVHANINMDPDFRQDNNVCFNLDDKNLTDVIQTLPILEKIHEGKHPVYAMIAPAFIGQFSEDVTPGKLRTAFKHLGFAGMVEVALFADILTLKEALEFDKAVKTEKDYMLTSCCCPVWLTMCRKAGLMEHMPGSVSPMVACGRSIKRIHPNAITVFIGPCLAKKAEAKEPDVKDAVDYVLTFQEIQEIFDIAEINLSNLDEDNREHSSTAGRTYAYAGGVSNAVQNCLSKLRPSRSIPLVYQCADGVTECKNLIQQVQKGDISANFLEGMGCSGGCVGGPRVLIDSKEGKNHVEHYGDKAAYDSPAENPYVIALLNRLGYPTVESLLEKDDIFTRDFSNLI